MSNLTARDNFYVDKVTIPRSILLVKSRLKNYTSTKKDTTLVVSFLLKTFYKITCVILLR